MLKTKLRQYLAQKYPDHELSRWFDPLQITLDKAESSIRIAFPHALFGQWFVESIGKRFSNDITQFSQGMDLVYEGLTASPSLSSCSFDAAQREPCKTVFLHDRRPGLQTPLERHLLSTFLVNRKNDFPFAVASSTVENALCGKIPEYTPVVIYGQSGTGKTHLLGGMANALLETLPSGSVHYGGLDILMRNQKWSSLQTRAVFLDDMQRVCLSHLRQERLIAMLDASQAAHSLVILCLDAHPAKCAGLDNKLLLRLTGGLVLELKKPDIDIRRQYVHQKNTAFSIGMSKHQELELAQRYQDFRSIDGTLSRVVAYRSLLGKENTNIAAILDTDTEKKLLTSSTIIKITAHYFSVDQENMLGKNRNRKVTRARQAAMFLIREFLGLSLVQVGRLFQNRDHSSVLYALKKVKEMNNSDTEMHKDLSALKQLCLTERS